MRNATAPYGLPDVLAEELRAERYHRLDQLMEDAELDAIAAFSTATPGQWGDLRFVTNYRPFTRHGAVVFSRYDPPVLFVPYIVHKAWARSLTWVEDVRAPSEFASSVSKHLQEIGCSRGRVGLVGLEILPYGLAQELTGALRQASLHLFDGPFSRLRRVKSDLDLRMMRQSAAIADQVFQDVIFSLRHNPSQSERDLVATAQQSLSRSGAETGLILISSGPEEAMPVAKPRSLQRGDLIQLSVEPVGPAGYWVQTIRMISIGEPGEAVREAVQACTRAIATAREALTSRPSIADAAKGISEILDQVGSQGIVPFGHGAGLDLSEPPYLSSSSEQPLEAGTALVIHPSLVTGGQNYFLGDTFAYDGTSALRLSDLPQDLVVI